MNQYIVNEPQAKALSNGASLLIVEIDEKYQSGMSVNKIIHKDLLPLKQGDEIFIAEEFYTIDANQKIYFADTGYPKCITLKKHIASEMTEQQSRFKFTVGKVSVKRVQDITEKEMLLLNNFTLRDVNYWAKLLRYDFIDWLKDQGIDYEANPWVALAELKEL